MFDGIQGIWSGKSPPMGHAARDKDPELARRMEKLRKALGFKSGVEMAKFLGVGYQRWMNVESGMPLGRSFAGLIKKRCQRVVGLDFLLDGDVDRLPIDVRKALGKFGGLAIPEDQEPPPHSPRRR